MENRKLIKFLIPIFVLGFFIANFNSAFAYEIETHAYLTSEVVKFYNQHFPNNKIPDDLIPYLIDGSRREDDIPRWMNHFYDPVYNRGLTDSTLGTWQKSKDWAQDSNNQNRLTYKVPATIASILTAIQQKAISALTTESDFTWQKAIKFYVQGEKEKAMFTLGHILHLIEDASVPDHTRNDPHPIKSYYEKYTKQFTLSNPDKNLINKIANRGPVILDNLNSYFDELAKFSNNNYYSGDTIGIQSGYNLPVPDDYEKINDILFARKMDNEGFYMLSAQPIQSSVLIDVKGEITIDNNKVLSDYWSRLSTKSIQYAAGIINLFFQEVEKAKNNPDLTKTENKSFLSKVVDTAKNLVAQVGNFFSDIFETEKGFQSAGQISLNQEQTVQSIGQANLSNQNQKNNNLNNNPNQENKNQENKSTNVQSIGQTIDSSKNFETVKLEQNEEDEELSPLQPQKNQPQPQKIQQATSTQQATTTQPQKLPQSQTISFKECKFSDGDSQKSSHQKVIINEVAWMGTSHSANDEWIELKNISGNEIDLTNWQLIDLKGDIKIIFGGEDKREVINKKIKTNGFYLLERTDDNSVPNITADFVYSGTLSNANEGLRLFDNNCNLIDEVLANPDWPAGENTSAAERKTMERDLNGFNWHTSNKIDGTPKAENTTGYVSSNGSSASTNNQQPTTNNQQQTNNNQQTSPAKILINEIQITGGAGKTENDFIELYNPNNFQVNLNGYRLVKRTKTGTSDTNIKSWTSDSYIPANGYYLWANSGYTDISPAPDITTAATISDNNGVAIRFGPADTGTIIDSVGWGEAQNAFIESLPFPINPSANQSIQRKFQNNTFIDTDNNASDFEIQNCPSPKAQFFNCSPNASANANAIQNFNIAYSSTTMELILNWQPPLNYQNSSTDTLTYYISEINGTTSTLIATTTLTSFRKSINEVGRDYVFSIQGFNQNGYSSATSTASTTVPSFLTGLYFYQDPRSSSSSPKYLIDLYYDHYPFIFQKYNSKLTGLVFYLNQESPPAPESLNLGSLSSCLYSYANIPEAVKIYYPNYSFYYNSSGNILVLPNTLNPPELYDRLYGGLPGGVYQYIINRNQLEDNHLRIEVREDFASMPTSQDYLKIAFYSYTTDRASCEQILVAIDKTKYYFGKTPPPQPPTTPTNFQVAFQPESENPYFIASWSTSTDLDSLDSEIKYQLDYWLENNQTNKKQWIGQQNSNQITPSSSGNYIFELKACDEFNSCSESVSASSTALIPAILVDTTNSSNWNSISLGGRDSFGENIVRKIAQKFNLPQATKITSITIGLANCWDCRNPSGARISLTTTESALPSEQEIISFSLRPEEIPGYNTWAYGNKGVKDFTFFITQPLELTTGDYFIVVEPENSPTSGFWNLVVPSSGNDLYQKGDLYVYNQPINQQIGQWINYGGSDTYFRLKGFLIE